MACHNSARFLNLAVLFCFVFLPTFGFPQDGNQDSNSGLETIERDVCILGGGAGGIFSALRLRDNGKSVVVVEKKDRLGGATEVYRDPATGLTENPGVIVYHNVSLVRDLFARYNISLVTVPQSSQIPPAYFNFRTGKKVDITAQDPTQALQAYATQLAKYPFLDNGFDLPDTVPEDLLLPFGDFVDKYNLHAMVSFAWGISQGIANMLQRTTLYVVKVVGLSILQAAQEGFITTKNNYNAELYEKAGVELGSDVLLNTQVVSLNRRSSSSSSDNASTLQIVVQTADGTKKLIKAKKLLVTIPPLVTNLQGFDLDATELSIFSQFQYSGYFTMVAKGTNVFQDGVTSIVNANSNTKENLPVLPAVYGFNPSPIPDHIDVKYASETDLPEDFVQQDVLSSFTTVENAETRTASQPEIVFYSDHTPMFLRVSPDAIRSGFYNKLNALQGHLNTFYTGATFQTQDSTLVWQFTDSVVLPKLLA